MPPSFGNAVVAANQQSICIQSNRDISTPYTEWAIMNNAVPDDKPKAKVKWKIENSTLRRITVAAINTRTTPSNSSPTLPQVSVRPTTNWRESTSNMQNSTMPPQNPFVQRADVCTVNAGHIAANVVQIGPWHGGTNSVNISTHHIPPSYGGSPSGAFYGGSTSPGMPGFFGYPQPQSAFCPYPHNSDQFGPHNNGFGQAWADMGHGFGKDILENETSGGRCHHRAGSRAPTE